MSATNPPQTLRTEKRLRFRSPINVIIQGKVEEVSDRRAGQDLLYQGVESLRNILWDVVAAVNTECWVCP